MHTVQEAIFVIRLAYGKVFFKNSINADMSDWTSVLQEQKKPSHKTSTTDNMHKPLIIKFHKCTLYWKNSNKICMP